MAKMQKKFIPAWMLWLFLVFPAAYAQAQLLSVSGIVRDSTTGAPLPNVGVYVKHGTNGTITDVTGRYLLQVKGVVTINYVIGGYQAVTRNSSKEPVQHVDVNLSKTYARLEDVMVSTRNNKRYFNKNNPAVELIRQVIAHKAENEIGAYSTASFSKYEKLCMYLDGFPHWISDNNLLKKFHFLFENKDTSLVPGKELVPVYLEETISQNYFNRFPEKKKVIITGQKKVDYGEFIDTHGISTIFNRLYEDIDIYKNNVVVATRQFISPIADLGPVFYKYYIRDTVIENNQKLVQLYFRPRNEANLLFTGTLFITLEGNYAVSKVDMQTNSLSNLGLIRSMSVTQHFTKDTKLRYHLSSSDVVSDFGITRGGAGMFGERKVTFSNFTTGQTIPDSIFKDKKGIADQVTVNRDDSFWIQNRTDTLRSAEVKTYTNINRLQKMDTYKKISDYGNMFLMGYKSMGVIDIGEVGTFLSYNPLEGIKPRLGGRTNIHFSNQYFLEGYGAYGSKDHQWKYLGRFSYALNKKSIYTYPLHYIRVSYRYDTNIPGINDEYVDDNILYSWKRGTNNKYLYNHIFRLDYIHETGDHFTYAFGLKYKRQQAADSLYFVKGEPLILHDTISSISSGELSIQLRWAPHEQYYQSSTSRFAITNRYPVFSLGYRLGIKGLLGGQYNYNNFTVGVFKRFYLSPFGYSDVHLGAGYVTGRLPWPLLIIHSGNQGFAYSSSYNMMNYLEFVSDHYASISVDHYFKGFFFNRIPLLKRLKLREVIAGKLLFGGIRNENMPGSSNGQIQFSTTNNIISTYSLGSRPYFEASVGISNIFKVMRIDVVKRFTYLDHPGISSLGIRAAFHVEL